MGRFFSKQVKRDAFARAAGRCQGICGHKEVVTGQFVYDHIVPYQISHDSTLANCQLLCDTCDAIKTYQIDIPDIAKSNRVRDRHIGANVIRKPLPCGRNSKRSMTMSGKVVPRLTLGQRMKRMRKKLGGVFTQ